MTTSLQAFDFQQTPVRVVDRAGQPWFVAADVCRVLDIANSRDAVSALDDDEKGVGDADTLGGVQKMQMISESGLYALIFRSRKKDAKAFRKWVTGEVLPTIRRNGSFAIFQGGPRVQQILEKAICDLYEGRMSLDKAEALATLASQYYRNGWKLGQKREAAAQLEDFAEEQREFAALVSALWEKSPDKEWTSAEMRAVAVKNGIFSDWLTLRKINTPSVMSRFGLVCERQCNRAFGNLIFARHGRNRGRFFTLTSLGETRQEEGRK